MVDKNTTNDGDSMCKKIFQLKRHKILNKCEN